MHDTSRVQKWDAARFFFHSSLQPLLDVLAMYYLIEVFQAGIAQKTLLAVVVRLGLIMGIPFSALLARLRLRINQSLFFMYLAAAASLLLISVIPATFAYIGLFAFLSLARDGCNPLLSDIYSAYPKAIRAGRYSTSALALIIGGLCFSGIINLLFFREIDSHVVLFPLIAIPILLAGLSSLGLPGRIFSEKQGLGLKSLFQILKEDRLFLYILIAWFLMGSANLWLITYRTNLLREEQFGFSYSGVMVLLLLFIIPETVRLISIPLYVRLFNRLNFIVLRIIINILFGLYIGMFFMGSHLVFHVLGMIFYGLAAGGGTIVWRLWITRYAPPEKSAAYMSLHAGFTGVRSVLTPVFGLLALNSIGPFFCALISIALSLASIVMLFFIIPAGRTKFGH